MLYLPENLKKYRILKNLTQEDVAEYLRVLRKVFLSGNTGRHIRI